MTHKKLLRPDRLRQVPAQFSWIDHRLIRQHRLRDCGLTAWALYLFLVTVADAHGLSYYSDASVARALKIDPLELAAARRQLVDAQLVAYQKPLYQVLGLVETSSSPAVPAAADSARSIGDLLRQALGGAA